jgi:hypothetical protein
VRSIVAMEVFSGDFLLGGALFIPGPKDPCSGDSDEVLLNQATWNR